MNILELKDFLDAKVELYERPDFLGTDPLQVPHLFTVKEDIEISAFLTATIAWGNRKGIIANAHKMMMLMDNSPYDFIINYGEADLQRVKHFVHRTFNGEDFCFFITALRHIYKHHGGLEGAFSIPGGTDSLQSGISDFKRLFFKIPHPPRTQKHLSDPLKGSAAKRINILIRLN